jgi:hypothetical protein
MRSGSRWLPTVVSTAVIFLTVSLQTVASGTTVTTRLSARNAQSEEQAMTKVAWTTKVKVSLGNGSWTFTSNGLPASQFLATDYVVPSKPFAVSASGANVVSSVSILKDQGYDYTLPLTPHYSATVTTTNQGPIGFLLDGGALYNPYEANHSTVATSDNFIATAHGLTVSFLDYCDGHPGPGGQYHYHGLPTCLVSYATGRHPKVGSVTSSEGAATPAVVEDNRVARQSVILGFAFDGYGIYDNVAMDGATVRVTSLDSCNGIFSLVPGYPKGIYHYVLENVKGARSSIGCFHGIVSSAYTHALEELLTLGNSGLSTRLTSSARSMATAQSLAANRGKDAFLRTMLGLSAQASDC